MQSRILREATLEDAPAIARIHVDAWRAGYRGLMLDRVLDDLDVEQRERQWRARIGGQTVTTIVSVDGTGAVRGFIATALPGFDETVTEGMANIAALYTDPATWGEGHGAALLDAALADLRARGDITRVTLWVVEGNQRAIGFYERRGFVLDGESVLDDERGVPDLRMTL